MIWGWYPEVVLAKGSEEKKQILHDIFDFWFNRDIVLYTQKMYEFKELTKQLSFGNWNILNYASLAGLANLSAPTVKSFIEILKETFIVFSLRPFFNNKLKEINKSPKLYFLDTWFRNYFINRFDFAKDELGVLFENALLSDLIKKWYSYDNLKFWRTNDEKYEVDLILEDEKRAFEFKYKNTTKISDRRWLDNFLKKYNEFNWEIINKDNFYKN